MPIVIARVDNLFWTNSSYKKPNGVPKFAETETVRQKPIMYSFMGGRTHLRGKNWNYAIYKGVYYFLFIDDAKDLDSEHYSYVLVRDLWVNIIANHNVEVNGRLTTTNRDEWIEANLNTAHPILTDPCKVTRLSLVEEQPGLEDIEVKHSQTPLGLTIFDIRELREFKEKWHVAAKKYKQQVKLKKYYEGNSPTFIFGHLRGAYVENINSWKEFLRQKINTFISDIGKKKDELVISKVGGNHRLEEKYCITWKKGGIGKGEESVICEMIDLSGLSDIVPINPNTLQPPAPNKVISESVFEEISFGDYQSQESSTHGQLKVHKVRRRLYFPITQDPSECGISLATHYSRDGYEDWPVPRSSVNWYWQCPQRLKLQGTQIKEVFLFWLDNVDFGISYTTALGRRDRGGSAGLATWQQSDTITRSNYGDLIKNLFDNDTIPRTFVFPFPFVYWSYYKRTDYLFGRNLITPLGFQIFQPFHPFSFDGYVWTGSPTNRIQYISGIRKSKLAQVEDGTVFNQFDDMHELPYDFIAYYNKTRDSWKLDNDNWNRFYFNILNGLDILFQPNQKGYSYLYRTWRWGGWQFNDRTSNNYPLRYLQQDYAPWKGNKSPFLNEARHKETESKRRRLINWITMKTTIEIPTRIKAGDYVFTDLDYWVDEYDTSFWSDKGPSDWGYPGPLTFVSSFTDKLFTIEDFLVQPRDISTKWGNSVVICSTREGKLEIRQCITFNKYHQLHSDIYSENLSNQLTDIDQIDGATGAREIRWNSLKAQTNDLVADEQAIVNVNLAKGRDVRYMVLQKFDGFDDGGTVDKADGPLSDALTKQVISGFLKSNGYTLSPDNNSVLFYERKDFGEGNPVDLFFDLVGTDWYVHIKQGRISLIAKSPEIFKPKSLKVSKLKKAPELSDLTTLEKVNQKCVLNIYTFQKLLNTRFSFHNDRLNVSVTAINPNHKKNPTNYFFVSLRGDYDVMEKEIIEVQKKQLDETATVIDYAQLESLRAQMRRNDRDYEIAVGRDVIYATEKENEYYRRQKWDLDTRRMELWTNGIASTISPVMFGTTLVGGQLSGSASIAAATFSKAYAANQNLAKELKKNPNFVPEPTPRGPSPTSPVGNFLRRAGWAGTAAAGTAAMAGKFAFGYMRLNEEAKRIEQDRAFRFRDIAYTSLAIDLRHRDAQEDQIRELNKMANIYSRGSINDMDMIEQFNKQNQLETMNLTVFTPTDEQLRHMEAIKEEYGIDCSVPNATVSIRSGMSEDVIRFGNLADEGIRGIQNQQERGYIAASLEMGIKVVDLENEAIRQEKKAKESLSCVNVYQISQDMERQSIAHKDAEKIQAELREQLQDKQTQLTGLEEQITGLNKQISDKDEAIKAKDTEISALSNASEAIAAKQKELEDEVSKHKADVEILSQKLNDERAKVVAETEKTNKLGQEKAEVEKQLKDCQQQAQTQAGSQGQLNEQVRKLRRENIKLKQKIREQENAAQNLTRELNACKNERQQALTDKDNCNQASSKKISDLEAKILECEEKIRAKQKEIDDTKGTLAANLQTIKDLQKQFNDEKKQLQDELHNHKVDVEELTQKLNDERIKAINEKAQINALTKEKAELAKQKEDTEKQLRDEITRLRNELDQAVPAGAECVPKPEECELIKQLLNEPYQIDLKERDSGGSAFMDLLVEIAQTTIWFRRGDIDQKLTKFPQVHPMVDMISTLESIPIIDKLIDLMNEPHWGSYVQWLKDGGEESDDIKPIVTGMRGVDRMITLPTVHGIKAALDELIWKTYEAKSDLKGPRGANIEADENLSYLFRQIFPGHVLEHYAAVFGDPSLVVTKRLFEAGQSCAPGKGDAAAISEVLATLKADAAKGLGDVSAPKEATRLHPDVVLFEGYPLSDDPKYYVPIYGFFHDAREGEEVEITEDHITHKGTGAKVPALQVTGKSEEEGGFLSSAFIHMDAYDAHLKKTSYKIGYINAPFTKVTGPSSYQKMLDLRNKLWKERDKIPLDPNQVRLFKLGALGFPMPMFVDRGEGASGRFLKKTLYINYPNQFQNMDKYVEDFLKLLLIFTFTGLRIRAPLGKEETVWQYSFAGWPADFESRGMEFSWDSPPIKEILDSKLFPFVDRGTQDLGGVSDASIFLGLFAFSNELGERDIYRGKHPAWWRFFSFCYRQIKLNRDTLEDPITLSGESMATFIQTLWKEIEAIKG